jgi:hypothetical protein
MTPNETKIGLESSSIMPLVVITPFSQSLWEKIWGECFASTFIANQDSIRELSQIFEFRSDSFYSSPITRIQKMKERSVSTSLSLKGEAIKYLADGQMGGHVGNKQSRVEVFFFSDVVDSIDSGTIDREEFCELVIQGIREKINAFKKLIEPSNHVLEIDLQRSLSYWGDHNVSHDFKNERRKLEIQIFPDNDSRSKFDHVPNRQRSDMYHFHMLVRENVDLIIVADKGFKENLCDCCKTYSEKLYIVTDASRKKLLGI